MIRSRSTPRGSLMVAARWPLLAMVFAVAASPAGAASRLVSIDGYACGALCNAWFAAPRAAFGPRPAATLRRERIRETEMRARRVWPPLQAHGRSPEFTARHAVVREATLGPPQPPRPEKAQALPTPVVPLRPIVGRGGYPGAIPLDPPGPSAAMPAIAAKAAPDDRPAWEQAALRVFQGLNDPAVPAPQGSARPSRRLHPRP